MFRETQYRLLLALVLTIALPEWNAYGQSIGISTVFTVPMNGYGRDWSGTGGISIDADVPMINNWFIGVGVEVAGQKNSRDFQTHFILPSVRSGYRLHNTSRLTLAASLKVGLDFARYTSGSRFLISSQTASISYEPGIEITGSLFSKTSLRGQVAYHFVHSSHFDSGYNRIPSFNGRGIFGQSRDWYSYGVYRIGLRYRL